MAEMIAPVLIRTAQPADAGLISVLSAVTFYEAYFEQDTPINLTSYIHESFELKQIKNELATADITYFLAFLNEKAVGYAKLRHNSAAEGVDNDSSIELNRIYLVERVWGTGIGDLLLAHCLEFARRHEYKAVWLGVWEENSRAQRFYTKHNFVKVGTIEFPYGDDVGINFVLVRDL